MFQNTSRIQAFLIHLGVSFVIISSYMLVVIFLWYPMPYFIIDSSWNINSILITVDLIIGPLLTLIVFKPGKKGLKFDMTLIIIMQLIAFSWGSYQTFLGKPVYIAFAVDRFILVHNKEIDNQAVDANIRQSVFLGPKKIFVDSEFERGEEVMANVMQSLQYGIDIEQMPDRYRPYQDNTDKVIEQSLDIMEQASLSEENKKKVDKFIAKHGSLDQYTYFPVQGREHFYILVLDKTATNYIDTIYIDPVW